MKKMTLLAALLICAGCFAGCGDAKNETATADLDINGFAAGAPADDTAGEESSEAEFADDAFYGAAEEAAEGEDFDFSRKDMLTADDIEAGAWDAEADGEFSPPEAPADEPDLTQSGEPFVLTAGEWNDNENWGFFANLVNNGTIEFPSYGLDPVNRIAVTLTHSGTPVANQSIALYDAAEEAVIWTAKTDRNGNAYLFYGDNCAGRSLTLQTEGAAETVLDIPERSGNEQGGGIANLSAEISTDAAGAQFGETEVMFILDTTGSMGDEITYLQKDFSAIAEEVSNGHMTFSVNFYRDEGDDYVTRCNGFTDDIRDLQRKLNAEYADGGGDTPEAVAEILSETMTSDEWHEDTNKIAFLIFDAPPHSDADSEALLQAAIAAAAERGIRLVPVVASNAERDTELFGRAVSIMTNSNYVFLTDDSGVGESHLEPIIGDYDVELLHDIIVRNIREIADGV